MSIFEYCRYLLILFYELDLGKRTGSSVNGPDFFDKRTRFYATNADRGRSIRADDSIFHRIFIRRTDNFGFERGSTWNKFHVESVICVGGGPSTASYGS